jgi:hypothetical protein
VRPRFAAQKRDEVTGPKPLDARWRPQRRLADEDEQRLFDVVVPVVGAFALSGGRT